MIARILTIVLVSVAIAITIVTYLLHLFVKHTLKNDTGKLAKVMVGLLVLQFILGMLANLFAQIPKTQSWMVFHEFGYISVHTVNAVVLLILGVIYLIETKKKHTMKYMSMAGISGIAVAIAGGTLFVNLGQHNIYSFIMALGFITAILAYTYAAFSGGNATRIS